MMMNIEIGIGVPKQEIDGYQPVVLFLNPATIALLEAYLSVDIKTKEDVGEAVAIWVQDGLYELLKFYLQGQNTDFITDVFVV